MKANLTVHRYDKGWAFTISLIDCNISITPEDELRCPDDAHDMADRVAKRLGLTIVEASYC